MTDTHISWTCALELFPAILFLSVSHFPSLAVSVNFIVYHGFLSSQRAEASCIHIIRRFHIHQSIFSYFKFDDRSTPASKFRVD